MSGQVSDPDLRVERLPDSVLDEQGILPAVNYLGCGINLMARGFSIHCISD